MATTTTSVVGVAVRTLISVLACVIGGFMCYRLGLSTKNQVGSWELLSCFFLFWTGSFTTCGYIVLQFYKLSPEESSKDPLYFVLVRRVNGCMVASLIDMYIHAVVFSVWVAFKESSWTSAFFWIVLLVCFRSIAICVYIVRQLFYLSPHEPISLIIFNKSNRYLQSNDPLLMVEPNA